MMTRTSMIALAIAGVVALGGVLPALAQDGTEVPSEDPAGAASSHGHGHARWRDAFVAALAQELGIEQSRVEDALAAVRQRMRSQRAAERRAALDDRVDEAVEAGQLTQEQADAIREAVEDGVLPLGGDHRGGRHRGHGRFRGLPGDAPSADAPSGPA
ncbi:MAG TPA: hypothetical protein VHF25_11680 [Nitriliruptorales bacterium]|nr:hypothetical protein [Nitriliruptorales bacterium]